MENNFENIILKDTRLNPEPSVENNSVSYKDKLIEEAKKRGNDLHFISPEIMLRPEELPDSVNWKLFNEDLTLEQKSEIESDFKHVATFLASPIFTDVFSQNHDERRVWERKYLAELGDVEKNIYKENRLRLNYSLLLTNFITAYRDNFKPEALNYLKELTSYISDNLMDANLYMNLPDQCKIDEVNQLGLIYREAVKYIGTKSKIEN